MGVAVNAQFDDGRTADVTRLYRIISDHRQKIACNRQCIAACRPDGADELHHADDHHADYLLRLQPVLRSACGLLHTDIAGGICSAGDLESFLDEIVQIRSALMDMADGHIFKSTADKETLKFIFYTATAGWNQSIPY